MRQKYSCELMPPVSERVARVDALHDDVEAVVRAEF